MRSPDSFLLDKGPASDKKSLKEEQMDSAGKELITQLVSTTGFWGL